MLFEKDKYYKYIETIEKAINFYYIFYIVLGFIIGCIWGVLGALLGGLIGFALATISTLGAKIKIQEMKWKMDIYEKVQ